MGTVVRLKKNIKWLCQWGQCACTSPSFLFDPVSALFFYSGIWPDSTCYFFVQCSLCEFFLKILKHITTFGCFHPFQYWIALLKSIRENYDNEFYMHKRIAVKYCIYISFFALYVIFFPAETQILYALEKDMELYFGQALLRADCRSGQRFVTLLEQHFPWKEWALIICSILSAEGWGSVC